MISADLCNKKKEERENEWWNEIKLNGWTCLNK